MTTYGFGYGGTSFPGVHAQCYFGVRGNRYLDGMEIQVPVEMATLLRSGMILCGRSEIRSILEPMIKIVGKE
jgi:hypothetical protein